jgi:hypothetical protein
LAIVGATGLATVGEAQFVQYTPSGTFQERRESIEKILERAMTEARWRVGRWFFDPWFGLRDFGYVDNVAGTDESDVTSTLGAGIRGWMPIGAEFTLAGHALPEYVWWQDLTERRRWNGRYGLGLFGNLGRTGVELTASRSEDTRYFSRELEDRVPVRDDLLSGEFEVSLGRGLSVFLSPSFRAVDYRNDESEDLPNLSVVDRDEEVYRARVSFQLPRGLEFGVGVEHSDVDFDPGSGDRSNNGTAPILLLAYEGSSLFLTADLAFRSLEPKGDSGFVDYDDLSGQFQVSWRTLGRLEPQLFANRDLVYSFTEEWAYFEDTSGGVGLKAALTRWANLRVFVETGDADYTAFDPAGVRRVDDYDAWGVDVTLRLDRLRIHLGGTRTDYDSNLRGADRTISVFRSSVSFSPGSGLSWD